MSAKGAKAGYDARGAATPSSPLAWGARRRTPRRCAAAPTTARMVAPGERTTDRGQQQRVRRRSKQRRGSRWRLATAALRERRDRRVLRRVLLAGWHRPYRTTAKGK